MKKHSSPKSISIIATLAALDLANVRGGIVNRPANEPARTEDSPGKGKGKRP